MYADRSRWKENGTISLIDIDASGKKIRVPKDRIPAYVKTFEDAENYCKTIAAERNAASVRAARRLEWQNRHFNFNEIMERFEIVRKEKAPNSWTNDVYYAKAYVLPFFLDVAQQFSPLLWSDHYAEFKRWLKTVEPIKNSRGKKKTLAVSTQNHCIKSLNNLLTYLMEEERMENVGICKTHPRSLVNRKTIENVMSMDVQAKIHKQLLDFDALSADFFLLLNASGMRESEAFGLSVADLFDALPPTDPFYNLMRRHSIEDSRFIVLESQVVNSVKIRLPDGTIARKPLKHRKKICREEGRTIPILDDRVWDMLVDRYEVQKKKEEKRVFGSNPRDYLLFEGLNKNRYYNSLKEACRRAGVREHSPHDSRHTYSTELVGRFGGDFTLAQAVLGHRDRRETEGYTHLYEQIAIEQAREQQQVRGLRRSAELRRSVMNGVRVSDAAV